MANGDGTTHEIPKSLNQLLATIKRVWNLSWVDLLPRSLWEEYNEMDHHQVRHQWRYLFLLLHRLHLFSSSHSIPSWLVLLLWHLYLPFSVIEEMNLEFVRKVKSNDLYFRWSYFRTTQNKNPLAIDWKCVLNYLSVIIPSRFIMYGLTGYLDNPGYFPGFWISQNRSISAV